MNPANDFAFGTVFQFACCLGLHGCLVRDAVLWLPIILPTGRPESTGKSNVDCVREFLLRVVCGWLRIIQRGLNFISV